MDDCPASPANACSPGSNCGMETAPPSRPSLLPASARRRLVLSPLFAKPAETAQPPALEPSLARHGVLAMECTAMFFLVLGAATTERDQVLFGLGLLRNIGLLGQVLGRVAQISMF